MATLVGKNTEFTDAIKDLLELEYDALGAYNTLIDRLKNESYKNQIKEFRKDHEGHIEALKRILQAHNVDVPKGPDGKQWLTKGKVVLANIMGDEAMLSAMASNEDDTVTAYERMSERPDKWEGTREVLQKGAMDEKRHREWMRHHTKAA